MDSKSGSGASKMGLLGLNKRVRSNCATEFFNSLVGLLVNPRAKRASKEGRDARLRGYRFGVPTLLEGYVLSAYP